MRRRSSAALVLLAAVVAGGLLGVVLIGQSGPARTTEPPPSPVPASQRSAAPSSAPSADQAATAAVAASLVDAITRADASQFGTLTCSPQTTAALRELQAKWDAAGPLRVALSGPPVVSGDRATVTVRVDGPGGHKETPFPLRRENGRWCVPG
ncbi:hypothetical protein [Amycolatopsis benzoatilytica]|uniref:hypothetical protein n=1 Tax=Amycolatopsis benzoatilytica TaxID=346045 RepID=UPI0004828746|nr:hypothetical protein [Amycolatopsis benzoatilytica]